MFTLSFLLGLWQNRCLFCCSAIYILFIDFWISRTIDSKCISNYNIFPAIIPFLADFVIESIEVYLVVWILSLFYPILIHSVFWEVSLLYYNSILVTSDSINKIVFAVNHARYDFSRMSFSLANAPGDFQKLLNDLFSDVCQYEISIYLGDFETTHETIEYE